jgi:hypothetical protein
MRLARVVDRELPVEADGGPAHQRHAVLHAGAVDGVAGGKVVGAVQHHQGGGHQSVEQGSVGALQHRVDAHLGVDGVHGHLGRFGLGPAHPFQVVRNLPLQVGGVHHVVVDQGDVAHARTGQVQRHWRTQTASPDDQGV